MALRQGIVGGSFDPVHHGHLHVAREARRALGLDRVLFVPAATQPLKRERGASAEHRLAMLRLALRGEPGWLGVSELELARGGVSYTVDTLMALRHELGSGAELHFVAGADALATLPQWHRYEEVLELARFTVVTRPGYDLAVPAELRGRVHTVEIPGWDVSSTEVRRRLRFGLPVAGLLPPAVIAYIRAHGLYGAGQAGKGEGEQP